MKMNNRNQSNNRRVVITGMGIMTGAGDNLEEFYSALTQMKTGVKQSKIYDLEQLVSNKVGEIESISVYRPYEVDQKTRLLSILEHVLAEVLNDANLDKEMIMSLYDRCILSMGTSVGLGEYRYEYVYKKKNEKKDLRYLFNSPRYIIDFLRKHTGVIGGYHLNTSACAASTAAACDAFSRIRNNKADISLVIGVDPLSEFSLYGFNSMKNMTPEICKPFDINRGGITIGEGGAALIFEEYEHAKKRNAKIYAEVFGYGLGNDAYHITSPDPTGDGAYNTMRMAVNEAGIDLANINYINAHGTGTILNDDMELKAIRRLFRNENHNVYVNSIKSLVGHCLGAAGIVELIATVLSVYNNVIFGTFNLDECEEYHDNIIVTKENITEINVGYAISNSFAFAGNSASIVIGKVS